MLHEEANIKVGMKWILSYDTLPEPIKAIFSSMRYKDGYKFNYI